MYLYNSGGSPPFSTKIGKNSWIIDIFMIKTAGGVYLPPDISITIHDNDVLKTEIKTSYTY